jgi:predicted amidohydrolase YtcJ
VTTRRLISGGRVFTSDRSAPWAEALVTEGERIVFVGSLDQAAALAGPQAEHVDAMGGVVMPGFVDAHAHLLMTGDSLLKAQLRTAHDLGEITARVAQWAHANPDAPRVLGTSWLFSSVPDGRPTRQMLDDVVSDRPVYLEANDLHSTWVNTRGLDELGITDDTPDPIGGRIVRDPATGQATGHLLENVSVTMVWPLLARVDEATRDAHLAATVRAYRESGVTTAVDMALNTSAADTIARAEAAGDLDVRVIAHWLIHRSGDPAGELAQVDHAAQMAARHHTDRFRIAGIKVIVDGTIDGCTAAMIDPYADGSNADAIWDAPSLDAVVAAADALGLQVALHAIGDLAVRTALDAIEHAIEVNPPRERRHRIEHLEYVDPVDVPRLAALGITASMQPVHIDPAVVDNWTAMLGDHRADRGFAWPEYRDSGATLAFSTDTPTAPHEPLPNMYIAATRKSPGDATLTPHRPDFAVPLTEAVIHGTRDAAWASWADGQLGELTAGAYADIIVLDRDPFALGPDALLDASIVLTISGGKIVHDARS